MILVLAVRIAMGIAHFGKLIITFVSWANHLESSKRSIEIRLGIANERITDSISDWLQTKPRNQSSQAPAPQGIAPNVLWS